MCVDSGKLLNEWRVRKKEKVKEREGKCSGCTGTSLTNLATDSISTSPAFRLSRFHSSLSTFSVCFPGNLSRTSPLFRFSHFSCFFFFSDVYPVTKRTCGVFFFFFFFLPFFPCVSRWRWSDAFKFAILLESWIGFFFFFSFSIITFRKIWIRFLGRLVSFWKWNRYISFGFDMFYPFNEMFWDT